MQRARRQLATAAVLGAAAIAAAGYWAFVPAAPLVTPPVAQRASAAQAPAISAEPAAQEPFSTSGFSAVLWAVEDINPSPIDTELDPSAASPESSRALALQLVAIGSTAEGSYAALYDPESDELTLAHVNDVVAGWELSALEPDSATLARDGKVVTFRLEDDGS